MMKSTTRRSAIGLHSVIGSILGVVAITMTTTTTTMPTIMVSALEVTANTWDEVTKSKQVFVKFIAPWCDHCKKMKPQWDQLQEEYNNHDTVVIVEFDCTTDSGKDFCKSRGVKRFPTLKYGHPDDLQLYQGARDDGSLKAHIQTELDFPCRPDRTDLCTPIQKQHLEIYMSMDEDKLNDSIDAAYGGLFEIEEDFEKQIDLLNYARRKLTEEHTERISDLKTHIKWIQKIKSMRVEGKGTDPMDSNDKL